MRKDFLMIALGLALASGAASADVLKIPEGDAQPEVRLPAKGATMADVEKKFGAPRDRRPTVGGATPRQPPITRWDYDAFSVIFEHDRVVDAVVPGAPPRVYHKDQLTPVAASAAPLPPMPVKAEPAEPAPAPEAAPPEPPPAESAAAPPVAQEPATTAPAEPEAPPAAPAYPDAPPTMTPAEEIPADTPPQPK
jgi:hypothetical protein